MPNPFVVIIGAGFGGLAMGSTLVRAGHDNFLIVESADDIGGVWRDNTYPGAACDVPSPLYSLSYLPNPRWPKLFSEQPDILDYLRTAVDRYRLRDRLRLGATVTEARFDDAEARWHLTLADGSTLDADVVVTAVGQLSRPAIPELPGLADYRGVTFHSARWNHEVDLTGKRVGVIGTGASAIQFVPRIQPRVAELIVFQRSAAWILPKPDLTYRPWHRTLLRSRAVRGAERLGIFGTFETLALGLVDIKAIGTPVAALASAHLRRQVPDPALRAALTPDYRAGCKRGLFSNDFYPALTQPNVNLVTDPIERVTATGIRTADGVEHDCDVIVFGTGFRAQELLAPLRITGRDGLRLADAWRDGPSAHLGVAIHGFPNLFLLYGPNTNLGAGSIVYMLESQAELVRTAIADLTAHPGSALEVDAETQRVDDERLQRRLRDSVWTTCSSWYTDANGRITTNWPGTPLQYRRHLRQAGLTGFTRHAT